jgi:DNA topoisomerase-1
VWLGATSSFKSESDLAKYEKARKLKDYIDTIRKNYTADWDSSDLRKKQVRATALTPCVSTGRKCA